MVSFIAFVGYKTWCLQTKVGHLQTRLENVDGWY